jgi:lipocalin-like protein
LRRLVTFFVVLFYLAPISAAPQTKTLSEKFVGAWRLISIEGNRPGLPGNFDRPTGLLIYDGSGRMSAQIVTRADRKPFAPYNTGRASATQEEKAAAFDSYTAYFGTYTIDGKAGTVTHHLEDSLVPGRRGTDNVRWFEFRGDDRLLLIPVEDGKGGKIARKDATYRLLWERIK